MKNLLKFLLFVLLISAAISGLYDYRLKHGGLKFLAQTTADKYTLAATATVDPKEVVGLDNLNRERRALINGILPAVVSVKTSKKVVSPRRSYGLDPSDFYNRNPRQFRNPNEEEMVQNSLGSGVIVSAEGHIITNNHVIDQVDQIEVLLSDGRTKKARLVGADATVDLAVLKIDEPSLRSLKFGDSDTVQAGDFVLAIGNPFGVGQTVTQGIVSGLGRSHLGINTFENFIQTDAAINPGNSGGALVDANGNLIGVNTAIYSRSGGSMGIGFAIPVSLARQVMDQIIATGSVTRGWIGVEVQDITPELAESFKLPNGSKGVLIAGVVHGGPADRAGVKPGDILVEVEGKPVLDSSAMLNLVAEAQPGKVALLKVLRNSTAVTVKLTVGKRPKPRPRPREEEE
jgi:serine protease DegQ